MNQKQRDEWDGVGMPDTWVSTKKIKTEILNPSIVRVKVSNGKKYLNIPLSLDWTINCFKLEKQLKKFLKRKEIFDLKSFLDNYKKLNDDCPKKVIIYLESFKHDIDGIIAGPPFQEKVFRRIKDNISGNRKRPTTIQRAFMNSLYFFEKLFNLCKEFKNYVKIKAKELELYWVPIYPYIK